MKLLQVAIITFLTALTASAADVVLLSLASNPTPSPSNAAPLFTNSPPMVTNLLPVLVNRPVFASTTPVTNQLLVTNGTIISGTNRMTPSWTNEVTLLVTNGMIISGTNRMAP